MPLFETLTAVEGMVFEAAPRAALALPSRWWFCLPFDGTLPVPGDESSLRSLLTKIAPGPRSARLAREGWPPETSVGMLLEVSFLSESQWRRIDDSLQAWVRRLTAFGARYAVDVIVHVQAHTRVIADAIVRRLQVDLLECTTWPIEAVRVQYVPEQADAREADARSQVLADLGVEDNSDPCVPENELRRWLTCAAVSLQAEMADKTRIAELVAMHPKIIALNRSLCVRVMAGVVPGPAASVLAQLDEIAPNDGELDAQLLSFVNITLPSYACALLRSYGGGARPVGQYSALRFAARSPDYVDAYVDGALSAGRFAQRHDLFVRRGDGMSFAANILRGLLRRRTDDRATPCIAEFASLIEQLGLDPEEESVPTSLPANSDSAVIWKLLAEPMTPDRLNAILRSPAVVRAAFGLINTADWCAVATDDHRRRRVMDMRANRALYFELPAPPACETST
jgi:hypothetical protein